MGAPAEVVQGFVTEPIERIAATVPGLDYVNATSSAGMSTVTVWLKLNQNSSEALAELSSRLSQIRFELPKKNTVGNMLKSFYDEIAKYESKAADASNKNGISSSHPARWIWKTMKPANL